MQELLRMSESIVRDYNSNMVIIQTMTDEVRKEIHFYKQHESIHKAIAEKATAKSKDGILVDHETFSKIINALFVSESNFVLEPGLADKLVKIGQAQHPQKIKEDINKATKITKTEAERILNQNIEKFTPKCKMDHHEIPDYNKHCEKCTVSKEESKSIDKEKMEILTEVYNKLGDVFGLERLNPKQVEELLRDFKKFK